MTLDLDRTGRANRTALIEKKKRILYEQGEIFYGIQIECRSRKSVSMRREMRRDTIESVSHLAIDGLAGVHQCRTANYAAASFAASKS